MQDSAYDIDLRNIKLTPDDSPNLAHDDTIVDEVKKLISSRWANIQHRGEIEDVWDDADKLARIKPVATKTETRAETACNSYALAVRQLSALMVKVISDRMKDYRFVPGGVPTNRDKASEARWLEADAFTEYFHLSMRQPESMRALHKMAHQFWKDGNCIGVAKWVEKVFDLATWTKAKFSPTTDYVGPVLGAVNIKNVFLDMDIDDLDQQAMIAIESVAGVTWTRLANDKDFVLPDAEDKSLRKACEKYRHQKYSATRVATQTERDNAGVGGDTTQANSENYQHWEIWINLPIRYKSADKATWDEDAPEYRHRVEILGSPADPHIGKIKPNNVPGGIPLMLAHESEDYIGAWHMPRSELIKTYVEQIQIAQNQMIDNRDRNCNRQFFYNPLLTPDLEDQDWQKARAIPTNAEPSQAVREIELKDMTGSTRAQIDYCEAKIREALDLRDVVLGIISGGRHSASEMMQANNAATAPIIASIHRFEGAIIVPYMQKFRGMCMRYLEPRVLVEVLGNAGLMVESYARETLAGKYRIQAEGLVRMVAQMERFQKARDIYNITKGDPLWRPGSIQEEMCLSADWDPHKFLQQSSQRDAMKAALLENVKIFEFGQWDEVEPDDMHDIHLAVIDRGLFEAQSDPNMPKERLTMGRAHRAKHLDFQNRAAAVGATPQLSTTVGSPSGTAGPTIGEQRGQEISAEMGNAQGGSSIPLTP